MVLILKSEGYFSDLCSKSSPNLTGITTLDKGSKECAKQDDRLNLVFTVANFAFNIGGFSAGVIFDQFGTWVTRFISW